MGRRAWASEWLAWALVLCLLARAQAKPQMYENVMSWFNVPYPYSEGDYLYGRFSLDDATSGAITVADNHADHINSDGNTMRFFTVGYAQTSASSGFYRGFLHVAYIEPGFTAVTELCPVHWVYDTSVNVKLYAVGTVGSYFYICGVSDSSGATVADTTVTFIPSGSPPDKSGVDWPWCTMWSDYSTTTFCPSASQKADAVFSFPSGTPTNSAAVSALRVAPLTATEIFIAGDTSGSMFDTNNNEVTPTGGAGNTDVFVCVLNMETPPNIPVMKFLSREPSDSVIMYVKDVSYIFSGSMVGEGAYVLVDDQSSNWLLFRIDPATGANHKVRIKGSDYSSDTSSVFGRQVLVIEDVGVYVAGYQWSSSSAMLAYVYSPQDNSTFEISDTRLIPGIASDVYGVQATDGPSDHTDLMLMLESSFDNPYLTFSFSTYDYLDVRNLFGTVSLSSRGIYTWDKFWGNDNHWPEKFDFDNLQDFSKSLGGSTSFKPGGRGVISEFSAMMNVQQSSEHKRVLWYPGIDDTGLVVVYQDTYRPARFTWSFLTVGRFPSQDFEDFFTFLWDWLWDTFTNMDNVGFLIVQAALVVISFTTAYAVLAGCCGGFLGGMSGVAGGMGAVGGAGGAAGGGAGSAGSGASNAVSTATNAGQSALGAVSAMVFHIQGVAVLGSLGVQMPESIRGMANSMSWLNLQYDLGIRVDNSPSNTALDRRLFASGNNALGVTSAEFFFTVLTWCSMLFVSVLLIHGCVSCCFHIVIKKIMRVKEMTLDPMFWFPKLELITLDIVYQGLSLAVFAVLFDGDIWYKLVALVILLGFLIPYPVFMAMFLIHHIHKKRVRFIWERKMPWTRLYECLNSCLFRHPCKRNGRGVSNFILDSILWKDDMAEALFHAGEWVGDEAFLNRYDAIFGDFNRTCYLWMPFSLCVKTLTALLVGFLASSGEAGAYTQLSILWFVSLSQLVIMLVYGLHADKWATYKEAYATFAQLTTLTCSFGLPIRTEGLDIEFTAIQESLGSVITFVTLSALGIRMGSQLWASISPLIGLISALLRQPKAWIRILRAAVKAMWMTVISLSQIFTCEWMQRLSDYARHKETRIMCREMVWDVVENVLDAATPSMMEQVTGKDYFVDKPALNILKDFELEWQPIAREPASSFDSALDDSERELRPLKKRLSLVDDGLKISVPDEYTTVLPFTEYFEGEIQGTPLTKGKLEKTARTPARLLRRGSSLLGNLFSSPGTTINPRIPRKGSRYDMVTGAESETEVGQATSSSKFSPGTQRQPPPAMTIIDLEDQDGANEQPPTPKGKGKGRAP